ncbi:MAG: 16S rRNA (cytidine(1402)-2'-O)-methyltransferase [Bacillota bacterium]
MNGAGTLYLVATPIGNMEDITLRALRVLKEADVIAAEDTRQTLKILNHYGIKNALTSYYEHNKAVKRDHIIRLLLDGKNVALVSDAGSPGISDPGEDLVKAAIEHGITVTAVPGPSAVITGLVLSGFPTGRFAFEGFLPVNKKLRGKRLEALKSDSRTLVFYEAPHRLVRTLKDLKNAFGNRHIAFARELTKKFEEIGRCTLDEAIEIFEQKTPRGEFVLILEGADSETQEIGPDEWRNMDMEQHLKIYMDGGMDKRQAMKMVAEDRKISKRDVYKSLLKE